MGRRGRVAWVVALTIVGVVAVVVPGGAVTKKGKITEFSVGITPGATVPSAPWLEGITAGPDGNVWFTENIGGRIGRITPTGEITEFPVAASVRPRPSGITAGPDGNVWFTFTQQGSADGIGRITPTGEMTVFYLPPVDFGGGTLTGASPSAITTGPDGNLWFTESSYQEDLTGEEHLGRIGRITLEGEVTEFSDGIENPESITAGCDGNLWFTDLVRGTIGRITPKGKITEFSAPVTQEPDAIPAGPDGNLWFTEVDDDTGDGQIGRIGTGPLPKSRGRRDPTLPAACPSSRR